MSEAASSGPGRDDAATTPADEPSDVDELRDEIAEVREELGDTVEAIAEKVDVKAQAKQKVEDTKQQAQQKAEEAREQAQQKAEEAKQQVQENPMPVAAIAGGVAAFVLLVIVFRKRRG